MKDIDLIIDIISDLGIYNRIYFFIFLLAIWIIILYSWTGYYMGGFTMVVIAHLLWVLLVLGGLLIIDNSNEYLF